MWSNEESRSSLEQPEGVTDRYTFAPDGWYLCRHCSNPIANESDHTEAEGHHRHTFTNPMGSTFRIACFHLAPGVLAVSEETTKDTWFTGCAWSIVVCSNCAAHLGWRFRGLKMQFYGLILSQIVHSPQPDV